MFVNLGDVLMDVLALCDLLLIVYNIIGNKTI